MQVICMQAFAACAAMILFDNVWRVCYNQYSASATASAIYKGGKQNV